MDICALCKKTASLIDSHMIPASAYKHVRGDPKAGGGSPVVIEGRDKSAYQTDKQVTQHLLCAVCEDLFSKNGEKLMGNLWWTREGFPLLEHIKRMPLLGDADVFSVHSHSGLEEHLRDGLFYFAMSVFWRAQVWDWGNRSDPYNRAMGSIYEKEVREYLLNISPMKSAILMVHVNTNKDYCALIRLPHSSRKNGITHHSFSVLGVEFWLYLGGSVSSALQRLSSSGIVFASSDFAIAGGLGPLANVVQNGIVVRGKLAKKMGR